MTGRDAGSLWESWIEGQHEVAKAMGLFAHVVHNEPHAKTIGNKTPKSLWGLELSNATLLIAVRLPRPPIRVARWPMSPL